MEFLQPDCKICSNKEDKQYKKGSKISFSSMMHYMKSIHPAVPEFDQVSFSQTFQRFVLKSDLHFPNKTINEQNTQHISF